MADVEVLAIQPNVYYTVGEAAELLRVSRRTMLRLLRTGRARGVNLGRQWRVLGAGLLDLAAPEAGREAQFVRDWLDASESSLLAVWDNEEDAVYDRL